MVTTQPILIGLLLITLSTPTLAEERRQNAKDFEEHSIDRASVIFNSNEKIQESNATQRENMQLRAREHRQNMRKHPAKRGGYQEHQHEHQEKIREHRGEMREYQSGATPTFTN